MSLARLAASVSWRSRMIACLAPALCWVACAPKATHPTPDDVVPPSSVAAISPTSTRIDPPTQPAAQVAAQSVLVNAQVITLDSQKPRAQAIAIQGGKIMALGSNAQLEKLIGPATTVIDLAGATIVPGLIEGHGHFLGIGQMKMSLDLRQVDSWANVVQRVEAAAKLAKPGETILGRGWHQEKWRDRPKRVVEGVPSHHELSQAAPNHAVVLTHASGHAVLVNQKALELSGITRQTPDPAGGTIVRDRAGRPTGYLRESAADLLKVGSPTDEALTRRLIGLASEEALAHGITSFHDMGTPFATIDVLRKVAQAGELPLRLYVMVRDNPSLYPDKLAAYRIVGEGNDHLTVRGIKHSVDGALGSHGAWLLAPYADKAESTGLNTTPVEEIERSARLAQKYGLQMAVHAIGDRGNREVLDLYARVLGPQARTSNHRWRIEHAQHLHPNELARFADLGVVAAMQGVHCTSDAPWVEPRLGRERAREGAYMWQSLWQRGTVIVNGTDAPVEAIDPIASYAATVTRRTADGSFFYPDQALTREQALRSYTINAAYAAFEEATKGTIEVGKYADLTVLSQNILEVSTDDLPKTQVLMTVVDGKVVYRRDAIGHSQAATKH